MSQVSELDKTDIERTTLPEGCEWSGPWRELKDPIWKWVRYYKYQDNVIGCIERRTSPVEGPGPC